MNHFQDGHNGLLFRRRFAATLLLLPGRTLLRCWKLGKTACVHPPLSPSWSKLLAASAVRREALHIKKPPTHNGGH